MHHKASPSMTSAPTGSDNKLTWCPTAPHTAGCLHQADGRLHECGRKPGQPRPQGASVHRAHLQLAHICQGKPEQHRQGRIYALGSVALPTGGLSWRHPPWSSLVPFPRVMLLYWQSLPSVAPSRVLSPHHTCLREIVFPRHPPFTQGQSHG